MLQRIQTIYLLLIVSISLCMLFFKIPAFDINAEYYDISKIYLNSSETNFDGEILTNVLNYYSILFISIVIIFSFLIILMYKKLELQTKLTKVNFIFIIMIFVSLYFEIKRQNISTEIKYELLYKWGISLPIILLLLNFLALRGMLSDKRKLKSSKSIR